MDGPHLRFLMVHAGGRIHIPAGAASSEGSGEAVGSTPKVAHSHGWQVLSGYWLEASALLPVGPLHRAFCASSWHGSWLSLE